MIRRALVFPSTRVGWGLASLIGLLAGIGLLGELGSKVGSLVLPQFGLFWLLALLAVALVISPASGFHLRPGPLALTAALLVLAWWPINEWRKKLEKGPPPLIATVVRPSQTPPRGERSISLDSLRFSDRRHLRESFGRRGDIRIEASGFLLAPEDGTYRFDAACDDRCSLRIDGQAVIECAGSCSAEMILSSGVHRIFISYLQTAGPGYLDLSWNRPAFFEFFPMAKYMSSRPAPVRPANVRQKEMEAGLAVLLGSFWWIVAACLVVRTGESKKTLWLGCSKQLKILRSGLNMRQVTLYIRWTARLIF